MLEGFTETLLIMSIIFLGSEFCGRTSNDYDIPYEDV